MRNELQKLGFTENEATVYLALVEIGQSGAGEIIKKTGIHRNIVYDTLDKLISKHLTFKFLKNKVAQFQVTDPSRLLDSLKIQSAEAQENVELARQLLPQLQQRAAFRQDIILYEGVEGFRTLHFNILERAEKGDVLYVLGSLGKPWYEIMGDTYGGYIKMLIKKELRIRMIAYSDIPEDREFAQRSGNTEIKIIPLGLDAPANVNVWRNTTCLQVVSGVPSVVEMSNPALAKAYLNYFEVMWSQRLDIIRK